MTGKNLPEILRLHAMWLRGEAGGARANLTRANLRGANLIEANLIEADLTRADLTRANLRGANLTRANLTRANLRGANLIEANLIEANLTRANLIEANLDFSCWPLWCGSLNVRVDRRIAAQLAYHFCRLDPGDDGDVRRAQAAVAPLANQFHSVSECGAIEIPSEDAEARDMALADDMISAAERDGETAYDAARGDHSDLELMGGRC